MTSICSMNSTSKHLSENCGRHSPAPRSRDIWRKRRNTVFRNWLARNLAIPAGCRRVRVFQRSSVRVACIRPILCLFDSSHRFCAGLVVWFLSFNVFLKQGDRLKIDGDPDLWYTGTFLKFHMPFGVYYEGHFRRRTIMKLRFRGVIAGDVTSSQSEYTFRRQLKRGFSRSLFRTSSSDTDCILTFSL